MPRRTTTVLALAATTLAAGVAVPVLSQAQTGPPTRSLTFQEPRPQLVLQDVAPKSRRPDEVGLGDRLVTTGPLHDGAGKRVGAISTECTAMGRGRFYAVTLSCQVTFALRDGQVVAAGTASLGGDYRLAVVGGTGAYAGVRGTMTPGKKLKGYDDADRLDLVG